MPSLFYAQLTHAFGLAMCAEEQTHRGHVEGRKINNQTELEKTGSDRAYHYLGSAIWFNRMGKEFAEALLELQ